MKVNRKSMENMMKLAQNMSHECTIVRKSNKLVIEGIDRGEFAAYYFEHTIPEGEPLEESMVECKQLLGALKGKTEEVMLEFEDAFLVVVNGKRKAKLRLKDVNARSRKEFPNLALKAKYTIESADLKETLSSVQNILSGSFSVAIKGTEEGLHITANDDLNFYEDMVVGESQREIGTLSKYGVEHLQKMLLPGEITLSFDNNYPILFEQSTDEWVCKFILAPVVDNT